MALRENERFTRARDRWRGLKQELIANGADGASIDMAMHDSLALMEKRFAESWTPAMRLERWIGEARAKYKQHLNSPG